jgi:hypothetical protein
LKSDNSKYINDQFSLQRLIRHRIMQVLAIVFVCIAMAISYGIIHDQITARICVEYFTIGHPPIFGTDDPTLLGLGWGVLATWWVGVLLGTPLAIAARIGPWPKRSVQSVIRPLVILMTVSAICACAAGAIGAVMASNGSLALSGRFAEAIPVEKHTAFIVDACAHGASYAVGFIGGGILIASVGWRRWKAASQAQASVKNT